MVIEAKSPTQNVDEAMQEASLYALELNKKYESGINPVKYVVGCNGILEHQGILQNFNLS